MGHDEEEIELNFEVHTGADGNSFSLHVESSEKMSYGDFLDAVRTFLESEEAEETPAH